MNPFSKNEQELRQKYWDKFGLKPPGINYDEFPRREDYAEYLSEELKKDKIEDLNR